MWAFDTKDLTYFRFQTVTLVGRDFFFFWNLNVITNQGKNGIVFKTGGENQHTGGQPGSKATVCGRGGKVPRRLWGIYTDMHTVGK